MYVGVMTLETNQYSIVGTDDISIYLNKVESEHQVLDPGAKWFERWISSTSPKLGDLCMHTQVRDDQKVILLSNIFIFSTLLLLMYGCLQWLNNIQSFLS